jgi:hypothetical protein
MAVLARLPCHGGAECPFHRSSKAGDAMTSAAQNSPAARIPPTTPAVDETVPYRPAAGRGLVPT